MKSRILALLLLSMSSAPPLCAQVFTRRCLPTIVNQAGSPLCLPASSNPVLGMLYPISQMLFVGTTGKIAFGTTTPAYNVEITNLEVGQNTLTLALVDDCPNGAVIHLNNTEPPGGRDWVLASWGSAAGPPGQLTGKFGIYDNTVGLNRMVFDSSGRVGIGVLSPTEKLHVSGNILATGTITPSDRRFKTNVSELNDALAKVLKLRGVEFDWRRDEFPDRGFSAAHQVGLIAQDVQQVVPEIVVESADGYLSVDYAKLTPLLVEAIRTQAKELAELRRANEELDRRVARLDAIEAELQRIEGTLAERSDSK